MKALRNYLDRIKPNFEEGGKLSKLKSTFGAFESFLFVPNKVTFKGSHIRDNMDMKRNMTAVIIALLPCLIFGMWNLGHMHAINIVDGNDGLWSNLWFGFCKVFPLIVVSYVVGLGLEFMFAQIRKEEVNEGFLVSGLLIPMIVPVEVPLWMVAVATAFAVLIGKEVYGGTGMNIVNPAILARAFLFFAYPAQMSGDKVFIPNAEDGEKLVDGFSGATPLADLAASATPNYSVCDMFFGTIPGSIGETSTLMCIIGAVILIYTGVASWKVMLSGVVGGLFMGLLCNWCGSADDVYMQMPCWEHLLLGGFAFGLVFMATDPVTGAQTETGKWIYGFFVGLFALLVRVINPAYPEGMMLSILFMNVMSPLIDHFVIQANINRRLKRAKAVVK